MKKNQRLLGVTYSQRHGFLTTNFLPSVPNREKIKVRAFFVWHWNALRTVCEACIADEEIDLLIITEKVEDKDRFIKYGYACVSNDEYDVSEDKPDVFFINYFQGAVNIRGDVRKHSRVIIVASQTLVPYQSTVREYAGDGFNTFIRLVEQNWGYYEPDFYFFDSYMYNHFKSLDFFKDKSILEKGNPKYDGIYRACNYIKSVDGWDKLDGKKVICRAADHGTWAEGLGDYISFDVYAKTIFEYMQSHPNMAMIFRPHHLLIFELMNNFWTAEDMNCFRKYCAESPNVVFDENDSYDKAFAMSDAIITDIDCGIRMSALPMMKPL